MPAVARGGSDERTGSQSTAPRRMPASRNFSSRENATGVGLAVGLAVGLGVGLAVGLGVGLAVGWVVGAGVGAGVGTTACEGAADGDPPGIDGTTEGEGVDALGPAQAARAKRAT